MDGNEAASAVERERHFLNNILKDFKPEHADFKPAEGMWTVGQQIKHVATTIEWFKDGVFGMGFDMDFTTYQEEMKKPVTLDQAMTQLNIVYDDWIAMLRNLSEEELSEPMKDNPIYGNAPKYAVLPSAAEHTAHHRGVLSVYLRLLGITPTMVYSD